MIKKIIGKFFNYQTDPSFYDLDKVSVEVSERDNIRSLHIGNGHHPKLNEFGRSVWLAA